MVKRVKKYTFWILAVDIQRKRWTQNTLYTKLTALSVSAQRMNFKMAVLSDDDVNFGKWLSDWSFVSQTAVLLCKTISAAFLGLSRHLGLLSLWGRNVSLLVWRKLVGVQTRRLLFSSGLNWLRPKKLLGWVTKHFYLTWLNLWINLLDKSSDVPVLLRDSCTCY